MLSAQIFLLYRRHTSEQRQNTVTVLTRKRPAQVSYLIPAGFIYFTRPRRNRYQWYTLPQPDKLLMHHKGKCRGKPPSSVAFPFKNTVADPYIIHEQRENPVRRNNDRYGPAFHTDCNFRNQYFSAEPAPRNRLYRSTCQIVQAFPAHTIPAAGLAATGTLLPCFQHMNKRL